MDNIFDIVLSEDKSLLYNIGVKFGMSEAESRKLTKKAQNIKITVIFNPDDGTLNAVALNGTPLSKSTEI